MGSTGLRSTPFPPPFSLFPTERLHATIHAHVMTEGKKGMETNRDKCCDKGASGRANAYGNLRHFLAQINHLASVSEDAATASPHPLYCTDSTLVCSYGYGYYCVKTM